MKIFDDEYTDYQYRGNRVVKGTAKFPNGASYDWTTLDLKNAVSVLAYNTITKKFILIRQYRPSLNETVLEQVAGGIEPHLSPKENAIKEVKEEIGYALDESDVTYLGKFYFTPGLMNFACYFYYAECDHTKYIGQQLEETELIDVVELTREQFNEIVSSGNEVVDPEIMTAFYLYDLWRG